MRAQCGSCYQQLRCSCPGILEANSVSFRHSSRSSTYTARNKTCISHRLPLQAGPPHSAPKLHSPSWGTPCAVATAAASRRRARLQHVVWTAAAFTWVCLVLLAICDDYVSPLLLIFLRCDEEVFCLELHSFIYLKNKLLRCRGWSRRQQHDTERCWRDCCEVGCLAPDGRHAPEAIKSALPSQYTH